MTAYNNPRIRVLTLYRGDVVTAIVAQLSSEILDLYLVAQILNSELDEIPCIRVGHSIDLAVTEIC